jgi:uncharacterized membrane protein YdjX (TVP38/TMEM64 family)
MGIALTVGSMLVLVAIVLLVPELRDAAKAALTGDTETLREEVRSLGVGGVLLLLALMLLHAFVWYPSEIPTAAAGFVYGFWVALPIVLAGWLISAVFTWWIGRDAARPLLHRLVGTERFERAQRAVQRGGVTILLAARLVPVVPFSLIGLVAGAAGVRLFRFSWTTLVGYLPLMVLVTLLGSRLQELSFDDPVIWVAVAGLLVLVVLARPLARKLRLEPEPEPKG